MRLQIRSLALLVAASVSLAVPSAARAQDAAAGHDHAAHQAAAATPAADGHAKMMAEMKAKQDTLDAMVKKMNAAKGAEKTDAIAELLTALVQEHKTMHEEMAGMPMMQHMMGNMDHGAAAPKK